MLKKIVTISEQETLITGEKFGKSARKGDIFALYGDLGSGKTVFTKGIAKGLDINDDITSPTFLLLEIYEGRLPLYHFDLYRIDNANDLDEYGFDDYWYGNGVSVIEWADKAGDTLPSSVIKIHIKQINSIEREITVEYPGN